MTRRSREAGARGAGRRHLRGRDRLGEAQFARDGDVRDAHRSEAVALEVGLHERAREALHEFGADGGAGRVAREALRRVLRVAHEERHARGAGGHDHARPDLDLHDEPVLRAEGAEEAAEGPAVFEGHPDGADAARGDVGGERAFGLAPAGGGEVGGDDGLAPVEEGADQGDGGAHLSERHGVDPDGAGEGGAVGPEAFGEVLPVERIPAGAAAEVEEREGQAKCPEERVADERQPQAQGGKAAHGAMSPTSSRARSRAPAAWVSASARAVSAMRARAGSASAPRCRARRGRGGRRRPRGAPRSRRRSSRCAVRGGSRSQAARAPKGCDHRPGRRSRRSARRGRGGTRGRARRSCRRRRPGCPGRGSRLASGAPARGLRRGRRPRSPVPGRAAAGR
jgi:hypothetical protein